MNLLAVVPARGGSKGVPGKNLRHVGGASLLGRSVAVAARSRFPLTVAVSTDSEQLASEARRAGAEVIERPAALADDTASSEAALLHALEQRPETEVVVFLQCTSPFLTTEELDRTIAAVVEDGADVAFTAVRSHGFLWQRHDNGHVSGINHNAQERLRRQDRPVELLETGAAYVMRADGFRQAKHRFFGRTVAVEVDPRRAMEIDTPEDLELARALAPVLDGGPAVLDLPVPKLLALDFDGVFTDNTVQVDEHGTESVTCHRGDGHGLSMLRERLSIVVFSTERNPVVAARCEKLGLPYEQGLGDRKVDALQRYCTKRDINLDDVMFVGNDVNDLDSMRAVGFAVAVADAVPEVRDAAHAVTSRAGGDGALRELADALLSQLTRSGAT
ncbi:MAG: acylneuraminate cytidylyltransferase [Nitriliruptoraceae bacterium]|nr:acylneuraminate cytidylyltransferase [Nitriliruptoraceae bacterium]